MKKLSVLSLSLLTLLAVSACDNQNNLSSSNSSSTDTTSSSSSTSTSTSTTSSSSTPAPVYDAEALLNHLHGSISLDGVLLYEAAPQDETLTSTVIESSISAYIAEDEYYLYEEDSEGYIYNDYHYFRGDNDALVTKYINRHNQVEETQMVYEEDNAPAYFDEVVVHPFTYVTTSDLVFDGTDIVTIDGTKTTDLQMTLGELVSYMVTGYFMEFETLTIKLDENFLPKELSFTSLPETVEDYDGNLYTETNEFTATFTDKTSLGVPVYNPYPEQTENGLMEQAMEAIANHNFTLTCYSSAVSDTEPSYTAIFTDEGILVTQDGMTYGYVTDPAGGVAYVEDVEGRLQALEPSDQESTIDEFFAPADYSKDLFVKTELGFELVDAYYDLANLLPDAIINYLYMYISTPLVFNVEEDLSKITYTYGFSYINDGVISVELTNFGTTVFPYDLETEFDPFTVPTSWEEVDGNAKAEIDELLGKDLNEVLPFFYPEEGFSYFGAWSGAADIEVSVADDARAQELLTEIETLLLENGYTYQGQNNHGEESYINAEGYEVGISYMDFFGSYSIAIYVYPPVAA